MADTLEQPATCSLAERDDALGCNPRQAVELLNDETARSVYLAVEEPMTVREISETLDLPRSTAYRTVERLDEAGLISQLNERSRSGTPAYYTRSIDRVTVTYTDPVRIECVRNGTTLYCEL